MEAEKIRPVAGNDRPFLISPRGIVVEALGVWEGLQQTAWEPFADSVRMRSHNMRDVTRTCNVAYLT